MQLFMLAKKNKCLSPYTLLTRKRWLGRSLWLTALWYWMTGQALAKKITDKLQLFGLDLNEWRGQGYNGAGNMSRHVNGCAAVVSRDYPNALLIHCSSPCLNLCVLSCTNVSAVSNMWSTLKEVCYFFSCWPTKKEKLASVIGELPNDLLGNTGKSRLVNLCPTRWVARHNA